MEVLNVVFDGCKFSLLFSVFVCTANWSSGKPLDVSPQWKSEIFRKASDYVEHVGIPFIEKELGELHIPEIKSLVNTPLGGVDYDLKSLKLSDVSIKKTKFDISKDHGLRLNAGNCSINIGAEWHYREKSWPHISDSGFCNVSMRDLALAMTLYAQEGKDGESQMSARNCLLKVGSLKVRFNGGASWLYNIFSDELADRLKGEVENRICVALINAIAKEGNKALGFLPQLVKTFFPISIR